jgi:hypothetical protein
MLNWLHSSVDAQALILTVNTPTINGSDNANVKINTRVLFSSNAYTLAHSYTKDLMNKTVTLTSCYYSPGFLTVVGDVKDTVNIGSLPSGTYTLYYTVFLSNTSPVCNPIDTVFNSHTFQIGPTSINELEAINKIQISPNPAKDKFIIKGDENIELMKLAVINMVGEIIHEKRNLNTNQEISIPELPAGIYFIEISTANRSKIIKLIKE